MRTRARIVLLSLTVLATAGAPVLEDLCDALCRLTGTRALAQAQADGCHESQAAQSEVASTASVSSVSCTHAPMAALLSATTSEGTALAQPASESAPAVSPTVTARAVRVLRPPLPIPIHSVPLRV